MSQWHQAALEYTRRNKEQRSEKGNKQWHKIQKTGRCTGSNPRKHSVAAASRCLNHNTRCNKLVNVCFPSSPPWRQGVHLAKQQQPQQGPPGYGQPWAHTPAAQEEGERGRTLAIANQAGNDTTARQRGTAQHANSCPVEWNNRGPGSDSPVVLNTRGPTHRWWYKKLNGELLQLVQRELNVSCLAPHKWMHAISCYLPAVASILFFQPRNSHSRPARGRFQTTTRTGCSVLQFKRLMPAVSDK